MLAFDASSLIHAWDNYPIEQFPPLWNWFAEKIQQSEFVVSEVAFQEVHKKAPECAEWLEEKGIHKLPRTNPIVQEALRIKGLLGIVDDHYHSKGVGENDLFIIATSIVHGIPLVTDEGFQSRRPDVLSKCKIPTVCAFPQVGVEWMKFIDLIKASEKVFS
jgi:predicted nucleic acid-binding protein